MTDLESRLSRRALLGAGVLVLAGCRAAHRGALSDPDAAAVAAAQAGELALLSSYADGAPEHAVHAAHLQALGGKVPSPGATATPSTPAGYTDLRASVGVLQAAAVRARAGATAALFASIAASHAVLSTASP